MLIFETFAVWNQFLTVVKYFEQLKLKSNWQALIIILNSVEIVCTDSLQSENIFLFQLSDDGELYQKCPDFELHTTWLSGGETDYDH